MDDFQCKLLGLKVFNLVSILSERKNYLNINLVICLEIYPIFLAICHSTCKYYDER
jgi:hypothetical protein